MRGKPAATKGQRMRHCTYLHHWSTQRDARMESRGHLRFAVHGQPRVNDKYEGQVPVYWIGEGLREDTTWHPSQPPTSPSIGFSHEKRFYPHTCMQREGRQGSLPWEDPTTVRGEREKEVAMVA